MWSVLLACAPSPAPTDAGSPAPVGTLGLATIAVRLVGEPGDEIGWDLGATDLDADGGADLVVAGLRDPVYAVVTPLESGPLAAAGERIDLPASEVAGLGDTDGNGRGDLAVAMVYDGPVSRGAADVVLALIDGADPGAVAVSVHDPDLTVWEQVGTVDYAVAAPGDTDGDGFADVLLGLSAVDEGTGRVWLLRGPVPDGAAVGDAALILRGDAPQAWVGAARGQLGAGGDWDGDGHPDLAIAAHAIDDADTARLLLVDGSASGDLVVSDAAFGVIVGQAYPGQGAGDLDGDGADDLLVLGGGASVAWGPVVGDRDRAALVDGVDGDGSDALESIAIAGDLDDDGVDDLALGAPGPWDQPGTVAVVYGPITGRIAYDDADARLVGESLHSETGHAVAPLGDVDRDGYDDFGVGAYRAAPDPADDDLLGGAVYVVFGGPR